jgi:hypothetical protein
MATLYVGSTNIRLRITANDSDGTPVDLSAASQIVVHLIIESSTGAEVAKQLAWEYETNGTDGVVVATLPNTSLVSSTRRVRWRLHALFAWGQYISDEGNASVRRI